MWTNLGNASGVYPPNIEGSLESVSIAVGGVPLDAGFTGYNDMFNLFRQYQMFDRYSYRKVMQLEGLQPAVTASNYACANVPFAINQWLGPLGSIKILDTTTLPPVTLSFRLAPNSILTKHAGNAVVPEYQWTDVRALVDILDISDGYYYNLISQRLSQGGVLEIPYENYQTVKGSFGPVTSSTRWSTSTDCLESVIGIVKGQGYDSNVANPTTGLSCLPWPGSPSR